MVCKKKRAEHEQTQLFNTSTVNAAPQHWLPPPQRPSGSSLKYTRHSTTTKCIAFGGSSTFHAHNFRLLQCPSCPSIFFLAFSPLEIKRPAAATTRRPQNVGRGGWVAASNKQKRHHHQHASLPAHHVPSNTNPVVTARK
ncbi:hypothetical protein ACJQWK_00999 [Exserohilum turcicum]